MSKDSFFQLLSKAIKPSKPEPKEPKKSEQMKHEGYNEKQTRSDKIDGVS